MTDEDWKRLRNIAVAYARKRSLNELAEDFAQEYLIEMMKDRKALMQHIFIDFLRREFGDMRVPTGQARSRASRFLRPLVDEPSEEFSLHKTYIQYCKDYMKNPLEQLEEEEDLADRKNFLGNLYRKLEPKRMAWRRGNLAEILRLTLEGNSREETGKIMKLNTEYVAVLFSKILKIVKSLPKFKPRND